MGRGLAEALTSLDYPVPAVYSRRASSARDLAASIPGCRAYATAQEAAGAAAVVFITTPDTAIAQVAAEIKWRSGQGAVHCCGAYPTEVLRPAAEQGALAGVFHPLQTLAGLKEPAEAAARLSGVTFLVDAEGWLDGFLREVTRRLGGRAVYIPAHQRALYHAAAVLGCGYLAVVLQAAVELWEAMGFTQEQALQALYPLSRATLDNLAEQGVASGVTGPVIRGDVATVRSHLESLFQTAPHLTTLYGALTSASLPLAARRGAGPERLLDIQELVDHYSATA